MQKIVYVIAVMIVALGIVLSVLVGCGKITQGALLLCAPMIMVGIWLFALNMARRHNEQH